MPLGEGAPHSALGYFKIEVLLFVTQIPPQKLEAVVSFGLGLKSEVLNPDKGQSQPLGHEACANLEVPCK